MDNTITTNTTNTTNTTTLLPKALFFHRCCSSGYKMLKAFQLANPHVKIESYTMLNVRDKGLHTQYNINLQDLMTHSIIIYNNIITKEKN